MRASSNPFRPAYAFTHEQKTAEEKEREKAERARQKEQAKKDKARAREDAKRQKEAEVGFGSALCRQFWPPLNTRAPPPLDSTQKEAKKLDKARQVAEHKALQGQFKREEVTVVLELGLAITDTGQEIVRVGKLDCCVWGCVCVCVCLKPGEHNSIAL